MAKAERRVGRERLDGDASSVGSLNQLSAIEQQGPAGVDGQSRDPSPLHAFDGCQAHNGYIKTHVLARLGYFDDHQRFPNRQARRALDGLRRCPPWLRRRRRRDRRTTTVWPRSSAAICRAISRP